MLNTAKSIKGCALNGIDGKIGEVKEFYFDDRHWAIRYLVADTGGWLPGRQVLLSPYALGAVNHEKRQVAVALTKKQIADSPSLDTDKPVSRQFESYYHGYYGWPMYWKGPHMWGAYPTIVRDHAKWKDSPGTEKALNPHLRSTREVGDYHIHATDGDIGHVEDFIIDNETWAIRYLIIDTHNWWPGKKVLVSPQWIKNVSWGDSKVFVNLTRELIKSSPEYPGEHALTRDYESGLHHHYKRQEYWVEDVGFSVHSGSSKSKRT
jgi:hypothetical protein